MSKTTLVPLLGADNQMIGHVPNRASKNEILGVLRCDCGEPCTVHNPRGKRSGRYYTICDECGTDQRSGDNRQVFIRANMVQTVEELAEMAGQNQKPEPEAPEAIPEKPAPAAPAQPEKTSVKPQQAANPIPPKAAPGAAYTANDPAPKIEYANKPKGLFVVIGAALGGLLAATL